MSANNDFTFTVSVSQQNFSAKPTKADGWFKTIQFEPQQLTVNALLDYATHGKVFCHCFSSNRSDGSFGMPKKENFLSTSTLFYDIDDSDKPLDDYIYNLRFKPSFAYTTFGNGAERYRFRLCYVFGKPIVGAAEYNSLYHAVAAANDFQNLDSLPCSQVYFGTNSYADTYKSDFIYRRFEFVDYMEQTPSDTQETITSTTAQGTKDTSASTTINGDIIGDIRKLKFDDFFHKYAPLYYENYKASLESPLIPDSSGMFYTYPEPYYKVKRNVKGGKTYRWKIGSGRKKKMFFAAKVMLKNLKDTLSIDNLLFNLLCEREWYYVNTDNKLNIDFLIETAQNAYKYDYPLTPDEHPAYRVNKPFWEEQGKNVYQAMNHIRGYLKSLQVIQYFNPYLTYKQNVELLNDNGIRISDRTLKRMVTQGVIQINNKNKESTHTYLSECQTNVTNEIIRLLKENGKTTQKYLAEMFCMDVRSIKRYFTRMQKEGLIKRVGNNRSGEWVVIEPQPQEQNVIKLPMVAEQIVLS